MTSAERAKALVDALLLIEPDDDGGSAEGLRVIADAIDTAVAEALAARWVLVGERLPELPELPEMGKPVLVAVGAHADLDEIEIAELRRTDTGIAYWRTSYGYTLNVSYDIIKAWQPLPAPWVAP